MIRPIQKRILAAPAALPSPARAAVPTEAGLGAAFDAPALMAQRSMLLKKQVTEFVRAEPETSVTAVRAWLQEEAQ
jgi:hypothetical protein